MGAGVGVARLVDVSSWNVVDMGQACSGVVDLRKSCLDYGVESLHKLPQKNAKMRCERILTSWQQPPVRNAMVGLRALHLF